MNINQAPDGDDLTRISLSGRFDLQATLEHGERFMAMATASRGVVVDLGGVDFLASVAIRLLISSAKANAAMGGRMVMASADPLIRESLEVSGLTHLIPLFDDYPAARAAVLA